MTTVTVANYRNVVASHRQGLRSIVQDYRAATMAFTIVFILICLVLL